MYSNITEKQLNNRHGYSGLLYSSLKFLTGAPGAESEMSTWPHLKAVSSFTSLKTPDMFGGLPGGSFPQKTFQNTDLSIFPR